MYSRIVHVHPSSEQIPISSNFALHKSWYILNATQGIWRDLNVTLESWNSHEPNLTKSWLYDPGPWFHDFMTQGDGFLQNQGPESDKPWSHLWMDFWTIWHFDKWNIQQKNILSGL